MIRQLKAAAVAAALGLLMAGCKKNMDAPADAKSGGTRGRTVGSTAVQTVAANLNIQLQQRNATADFARWHGQPLWERAVTLPKEAGNAIVLVPTVKDGAVAAFVAAKLSNGQVTFELHRRSAIAGKTTEATGMNISPMLSQLLLSYFNNAVYNKVDQVPLDVYQYARDMEAAGNGVQADNMISICWNVGYCEDCPGSPTVCCYTRQVCTNITYDDGGGISPGPIGGGGGGSGGGGNPGPDPGPGPGNCPPDQAYWFTENPTPNPVPCPGSGGVCNMSPAEGLALANSGILTNTNDVQVISGPESAPDANGVIRKPKILRWQFVKVSLTGGLFSALYVRYTASFAGVVYKNGSDDPTWKWESLNFDRAYESANTLPMCVGSTIDVTAGTPVIQSNPEYVSLSLSYAVTFKVTCVVGNVIGQPYISSHPPTDFSANREY